MKKRAQHSTSQCDADAIGCKKPEKKQQNLDKTSVKGMTI
jgi:hypothetical protein